MIHESPVNALGLFSGDRQKGGVSSWWLPRGLALANTHIDSHPIKAWPAIKASTVNPSGVAYDRCKAWLQQCGSSHGEKRRTAPLQCVVHMYRLYDMGNNTNRGFRRVHGPGLCLGCFAKQDIRSEPASSASKWKPGHSRRDEGGQAAGQEIFASRPVLCQSTRT
jgi:hypothetical protein